ncbi:uncharacterized protein [Palaemon carinicauda]|uniref:uncharacterized protein n=1 Tax=Palaemon carinicauda TaxID=392227 RepID=UPI0035B5F68A
MNPEDIPKAAIITYFGTCTFNYSRFCLRNAESTFQLLMAGIIGDLPFCEGVQPLLEKVAAVQNLPTPSAVKALHEFLAIMNYYYRFLLAIAANLALLYISLKGMPKDLKCGPLQEVDFCNAKNALQLLLL